MLFFATASDSTEIKKLQYWETAVFDADLPNWKLLLSVIFEKNNLSFVDFFRFDQNQQLSAN